MKKIINFKEGRKEYALDYGKGRRDGNDPKNRREGGYKTVLEALGFVAGGAVTVVSEISGSLIVAIKDSRVAVGKEMAGKILVTG